MNYKKIQEQLVLDFKIIMDPESKCWSRTHAHCKERKICKLRIKESYGSLFSLLHEIGHIETDKSNMKRAEQESVATLWARTKIQELRLPVKRNVMNKYKAYITNTYRAGVRHGLQKRIKSSLYMFR